MLCFLLKRPKTCYIELEDVYCSQIPGGHSKRTCRYKVESQSSFSVIILRRVVECILQTGVFPVWFGGRFEEHCLAIKFYILKLFFVILVRNHVLSVPYGHCLVVRN